LISHKPVCIFHVRNAIEVFMTLARLSLSLAAGCVLGAALVLPAPAAARTSFDGNWSVLIVTRSGPCDQAYRYGLSIRDGRVAYEGSAAVNVAGEVTPKGIVNVRVWAGSQNANGEGRLSRDYGGGEWNGNGSSGNCSGTWSAERR
jgi:hypothetical protein